MRFEYVPPTESERQRRTWFKQHSKPGMTPDEFWKLNSEAFGLFPVTEEERQLKFESKMGIPEFVL